LIKAGTLKVVGGVYDIGSGKVDGSRRAPNSRSRVSALGDLSRSEGTATARMRGDQQFALPR